MKRIASAPAGAVVLTFALVILGGLGVLLREEHLSGGRLTGAEPSPEAAAVAYALGSPDGNAGGLVAMELPSGRVLGRFADMRRQGGGLAFAPDGLHAYLLDGPYLHELELPSLRELRAAELPDAITPMGHALVLAVSADGHEVYVQAVHYLGQQRLAADRKSSQPDSEDSIAVYDVVQAAFTRRIPLEAGTCGLSQMFVRPDGRLVVFCAFAEQARLVDTKIGRQVGMINGISGSMVALTADGRRLLVVDRGGSIQEVDLDQQQSGRRMPVAPPSSSCSPCIPYQILHLSADGTRLFVRAAPGRPDLVSTGQATQVWIVDTSTLQLIGEVRLPAPAFDSAPLPDGRALLTGNTNTQDAVERASRLVQIPTGSELAQWPGGLVAIEVRTVPTAPALSARPSATATATARAPRGLGRIAFLRAGDVWVKELPDGPERQLTHDGLDAQPRWSRSGDWVAFTKAVLGATDTAGRARQELWLVRPDGSDPHRLDTGPIRQFRWSPAADRIAFGTPNGAVIIDADGSNRRTLPGADAPVWSPDGTWLAYTRIDPLTPAPPGQPHQVEASLWIAHADGSGARKLLDGGTPSYDGYVVAGWSPNGQYVLYWTDPYFSGSILADGTPLIAVPVTGGQPVEVVDRMLLYDDAFQWSLDGSHLAVMDGGRRMTWENKAIAVTTIGASIDRLSDPARADVQPAWSPDGRWIAFSSGPAAPGVGGGNDARHALDERRIWVMQADGSAKHQLTNAGQRDEWARWSSDASHIIFVRLAEEHAQLWLMRADGTDQHLLLDDLSKSPTASTQPPLWWGFYGYTNWSQFFDWWQGPRA